jgi:hypothetical protein
MTISKKQYSLVGEAFKSFLRGFPFSLIVDLVIWLTYLAFSTNLLHHRFFLLLNLDAWDTWKLEVARFSGLIPFSLVMFFLVGMIQFFLICFPFAKWVSKGLQEDARRSALFYVTSGVLVGAGPWILLILIFAKPTIEALNDNAFFIFPSLATGLITGAILKRRLVKLAEASGIEISIK